MPNFTRNRPLFDPSLLPPRFYQALTGLSLVAILLLSVACQPQST